jgi:hypothetical protein
MISTNIKPKTCKVCKTKFTPAVNLLKAKVCSFDCAQAYSQLVKERKARKEKARDKRETKAKLAKLAKMKTRGQWIAEAQAAFNTFIRARDAGKPCICCGRTRDSSQTTGGIWDAGHFRSRGSAPHLRFDERNVHAQLKYCNRYASGNMAGYRLGLIERIGLVAVEELEADQTPRKWSIDDLKAIKAEYVAKTKALRGVN